MFDTVILTTLAYLYWHSICHCLRRLEAASQNKLIYHTSPHALPMVLPMVPLCAPSWGPCATRLVWGGGYPAEEGVVGLDRPWEGPRSGPWIWWCFSQWNKWSSQWCSPWSYQCSSTWFLCVFLSEVDARRAWCQVVDTLRKRGW